MTGKSFAKNITLGELTAGTGIRIVAGDRERPVTAIVADSRQVAPGNLFVAFRGETADGHDYLAAAVDRGCVAVVVEREAAAGFCRNIGVAVLVTPNGRAAVAALAARFYGHPERELKMIGLTGTNGKTTTSYLLEGMIQAGGGVPGVIGTISYRFKDREDQASFTTPEPITLYRLMREMVDGGVDHLIMEVSSHALVQKRLEGIKFDVAVFTNLSREHLDFHVDMDDYFQVKSRLFREHLKENGVAVVMLPDETDRAGEVVAWGDRLAADLLASGRFGKYGEERTGSSRQQLLTCGRSRGDIHVKEAEITLEGIKADFTGLGGDVSFQSPLVGDFNLLNMATAAGTGYVLGLSNAQVGGGIAATRKVPGRLERVRRDDNTDFDPEKCRVFVDFAHTPDALQGVLQTVKALCRGRLVVVFGCGGDRDRGKRPIMGGIAARVSDVAIITTDNSRSENPLGIMAEIEQGIVTAGGLLTRGQAAELMVSRRRGYDIIESRREAIRVAIRNAAPEDVVLICGKGHETSQIVAGVRHFFDDRLEARQQLADIEHRQGNADGR